jgi:hypothetical protein
MNMTQGGMIPDSQHNLTKGFVFKSEQAWWRWKRDW